MNTFPKYAHVKKQTPLTESYYLHRVSNLYGVSKVKAHWSAMQFVEMGLVKTRLEALEYMIELVRK